MVDHRTRITVDADGGRAAEMARALAARGFEVRVARRRFVAESTTVEATEAKEYLRSLGFHDREFRVYLEYVRRWGVL
jgi:hypothetical protein